jgi:hypothetical protein
VFENKVLRRIFGPKRDEVTGGWKKLHNEELRDLYSSSIIIIIKSRRMRWAGHVARMGEKRNACRLFVGKPEGKRPLGRPRRRWADNIKKYRLEDCPPCTIFIIVLFLLSFQGTCFDSFHILPINLILHNNSCAIHHIIKK